jgi:hypothetical protein
MFFDHLNERNTMVKSVSYFDNFIKWTFLVSIDVIRNFMVVALGMFLCPNLTEFASSEYLMPLVDALKYREWN